MGFQLSRYFEGNLPYRAQGLFYVLCLKTLVLLHVHANWMCVLCVKSLSHIGLFAAVWTVAHQGPLSLGFSRQEYWSRLPCSSPGDHPNLGIEAASPALADGFFTTSATWEKAVKNMEVMGNFEHHLVTWK